MADDKPLELSTNAKTPFLIENILHQKNVNLNNIRNSAKYSMNNNNINHNNNLNTHHSHVNVMGKKFSDDTEDPYKKSMSDG